MKLDTQAQRSLDRLGDEFVVNVLRREATRRENLDALVELGATLTRLRRYDEGLLVDLRLVRLKPEEPIVHYNLACSLALLRRCEEALDELEKAVELGYEDSDHLAKDRDLRSLRRIPRFGELLKRLRELEGGPALDPESNIPD